MIKIPKLLLFHWVPFPGKDNVSIPGYTVADPNVIGWQLTAMQKLGEQLGATSVGAVALTYGPTVSTFIHSASMEMCDQCNERAMPFALCFDPWTVKESSDKDSAMITALKNPDIQSMLNSPMYLPGKPVLDFSTGCDAKTVLAGVSGIQYWMEQVDYAWPKAYGANNVPNTISQGLASLSSQHANPACRLPCVYRAFDNRNPSDPEHSIWDPTLLACTWCDAGTGTSLFAETIATVPTSATMVQVATWCDFAEGTAVEPAAWLL